MLSGAGVPLPGRTEDSQLILQSKWWFRAEITQSVDAEIKA